ncbi:MAG: hypothetical protein K6B46_06845 [Opitutales bacterium]|nr:hypothetical protein [Opitutales bacterium]
MKKWAVILLCALGVPVVLGLAGLAVLSSDGVQRRIVVAALRSAGIEADCGEFCVSHFSDYRISDVRLRFKDGTVLSSPSLVLASDYWGLFFTGTLQLAEPADVEALHGEWSVPAQLDAMTLDFERGICEKINLSFSTDFVAGTGFKVQSAVVDWRDERLQLKAELAEKHGSQWFLSVPALVRDRDTGTVLAEGNVSVLDLDLSPWLEKRAVVRPQIKSAAADFRLQTTSDAGGELKIARIRAELDNHFLNDNRNAVAVGNLLNAGTLLAGNFSMPQDSKLGKATRTLGAVNQLYAALRETQIDDGRVAFSFDGGNALTMRSLLLRNEILELRGNAVAELDVRQVRFDGELEGKGDLAEIFENVDRNPYPLHFDRQW